MFDISGLGKKLEYEKNYLIHDVKDFLAFVIVTILGVLIFYKQTQDEFTATLILSSLWILFWKEADLQGKVFLVFASVIGYLHELIGVRAGFFTYLGGIFGGVPLWVLPGYGAIFWSSYNFWKLIEKKYHNNMIFSKMKFVAMAITFFLVVIDYLVFDFSVNPIRLSSEFILSLLLFKTFAQMRLAYFVALFTVFDEIAGELIGTWNHPVFSIFSLMSGYILLLWISITIKELLQGKKKWGIIEVASALVLFGLFIWDVLNGGLGV